MGQFNPAPAQDFIGRGLAFPVVLTAGSATLVTGGDLVKSSIASILAYSLGHRFFLGEYGSRIQELLEEPNEHLLVNVLENFITSSLTTWEKRIKITSIVSTPSTIIPGIDISISYIMVNTQEEDNFIWPFYNEFLT